MGTIQDADKVWVNENFCGETFYTYPPRRYVVPTGSFKTGKNTITLRILKNGAGPIRFFKEKPYFIFTDDIEVQPSTTRNIELFKESEKTINSKGIKISLSGTWKKMASCEKLPRPGEMFFEWEPAALYNSMLSPAFNYAVSGALWYQGESNAGLYFEYKDLLVKMAKLWRGKFKYAPKNIPFVVAQLPNWANGEDKNHKFEIEDWAELRKAQSDAVNSLENAGLAVLIDAGEWNDLHPESKRTVGERCGREALRIGYNKTYSKSPVVADCKKDDKSIMLSFDCSGSVLKAYKVENECAKFDKEGTEINGLELVLDDDTVMEVKGQLVSSNEIKIDLSKDLGGVKEVSYLWKNNPWIVNLYSSDGIPVAPFKIKI